MLIAVLYVVCSFIMLLINTFIAILKPDFSFATNDEYNYSVYYQKWIHTITFIFTFMLSLISIYFALSLKTTLSLCFLILTFIFVMIYATCKYKDIIVMDNTIKVERLFRKVLNTSFDDITNVEYFPDAKMIIHLKKKKSFEVSSNTENFYKLYFSLINHDIKFKTGKILQSQSIIILPEYNMTIDLPKKMFREYYQMPTYFRNSRYLFSARSLEYNEHIEGYKKESGKTIEEFIELVKNDLKLNNFNIVSSGEIKIQSFTFYCVKSINKMHKDKERLAYILNQDLNYLVLYLDFDKDDEESFTQKVSKAIRECSALDPQSGMSVVK